MDGAVPAAAPAPMGGDTPPSLDPAGIQPQSDVPVNDPTVPQAVEPNDLAARIEQEKEFYRQKKQMGERERALDEREAGMAKPKSVDEMLDDILNNKEGEQQEE